MNIDAVNDRRPADHPKPYEVQCHIDVSVAEHEVCVIKFNAIVDPGSPISFLKCESVVPNNYSVIKPAYNNNFYGINGAKLNILGIFVTYVTINNNIMDFRFYIVPNITMLSDAILGRDLLPNYCLLLLGVLLTRVFFRLHLNLAQLDPYLSLVMFQTIVP
jgi:hypothetical protein